MKGVLVEITDAELDEILGAGDGVMHTLTHECHMNTWQFLLTCCKDHKEVRKDFT